MQTTTLGPAVLVVAEPEPAALNASYDTAAEISPDLGTWGLNPDPCLRTRGMAVVQARLSMDLAVRSQGNPVEANGVAVLRCCTSRPC